MPKAKAKKKNISQRVRFIEAAREAECSDDEGVFDRAIKHIATATPKPIARKGGTGDER